MCYGRCVARFWAGFGAASLVWGAVGAYLALVAGFGPPAEAPPAREPEPVATTEPAAEAPAPTRDRRRRRRARAEGSPAAEPTPRGEATTGDLGEDAPRVLDMGEAGGEQQLSAAQIESTFDSGMGRIRRCLVLMARSGSGPTGRCATSS
jgi:hypothetical protein